MLQDLYIIALALSGFGFIIALILTLAIGAIMDHRIDKKIANENNR